MGYGISATEFFEHRFGVARLAPTRRIQMVNKGLELSKRGRAFVDTFGNREFCGYVGFIDLRAFSNECHAKSPKEIRDYVCPFVETTIASLECANCFIDKTVGDEVLFVLPDSEAEDGIHVNLKAGLAMGGLAKIVEEFEGRYPFRLGLAYGKLMVDRIHGQDFGEWTTFGEPVHLAKRLHSLDALARPDHFVGAFGMLKCDLQEASAFDARFGHITLVGQRFPILRWGYEVDLKGVGLARVGLFGPQTDR